MNFATSDDQESFLTKIQWNFGLNSKGFNFCGCTNSNIVRFKVLDTGYSV